VDEVAVCKLGVPHGNIPGKCRTELTTHDHGNQTETGQTVVASQEWRSEANTCWQERSVGLLSSRELTLGASTLDTFQRRNNSTAQLQQHVARCSHHHQWMPACVPMPSAQHMPCPHDNRAVVKTPNTQAHLLCTHECTREHNYSAQILASPRAALSSKASGTLTRRYDASGATLVHTNTVLRAAEGGCCSSTQ